LQSWARGIDEAKTDGISLSLRIDQTSNKVKICSNIGSSGFGFDKSSPTDIQLGA